MVEHQSSSAPQPRFAPYTYGTTLFRILYVTYAVSCMTFLRVLQVTLTAPCSTIIATLLEVFLVTFVASCCTVRTTLFRILHVIFVASCMTFLRVFHLAVMALCCTISLNLLDNPPSFCQLSSDCLLHSTTPRVLHTFTLTCSHLLKSHEISCGKYVMQ